MPAPALLGPLIVAGGQVAGAGINAAATGSQNRRSREWSERMYRQQYSDNIEFWRMQNEYNSPQAQMQRLQAAGLNPNLVYGGSSAGAAGQAGSIQTPDVQPVQFRTPEFGSALMNMSAYFDTQIKQAQTDNLKMQNTVLLGEAALKAAQTSLTGLQGERTQFDLDFAREMKQVSADAMRAALDQTRANTQFTLNEDERKAAQNSSGLLEAAERIASMRADRVNTVMQRREIEAKVENIKRDSRLKQLDAELRQIGLNPNDPAWQQALGRILTEMFGNPVESATDWFKSIFK